MAPIPTKETICLLGGGNATHVMTALFASKGHEVRILSTFKDEAERLGDAEITCTQQGMKIQGKATKVSKNPAEVVPGCSYIICALPAFAHEGYLRLIEPYLSESTIVGAFAGQGGFDLLARHFGCSQIFAGDTLPWACRIIEFGKHVEILGTKTQLDIALSGDQQKILGTLQTFIGPAPRLVVKESFLSITIMNPNAICHPAILYGRWHNSDSAEEPPLFYAGVDAFTADLLAKMSDEVLNIKSAILDAYPNVDLSGVVHITDYLRRAYPDDIKDVSSLQSCFITHVGYVGLTHPCLYDNDLHAYVPNFQHRYLSEDIPCGLVVVKGIAELCHTPTPTIDLVLDWSQKKLGLQFLLMDTENPENPTGGPTVSGAKDLHLSRAPQAYGFCSDLHAYMLANDYISTS